MKNLKYKDLTKLIAFGLLVAFVPVKAFATNCKGSTSAQLNKCLQTNPIVVDLNRIVNFLSIGVGVIVTGVIIFGGIQYTMAGDNTQQLTAAKQKITNGLFALFAFMFIFAFVNWLIPGGVFK